MSKKKEIKNEELDKVSGGEGDCKDDDKVIIIPTSPSGPDYKLDNKDNETM